MRSLILFLGLTALAISAAADTPAHCLPSTITSDGGRWVMQVGKVRPHNFRCSDLTSLESVEGEITVELSTDNVVRGGARGSFTSIYDEGFEATLIEPEHKLGWGFARAFAYADWETVGKNVVSKCGQTKVGWVVGYGTNEAPQGDKRCYQAHKVDSEGNPLPTLVSAPIPEVAGSRFVYTREVAEAHAAHLNGSTGSSWTAGVNEEFIGLTMAEIGQYLGAGNKARKAPAAAGLLGEDVAQVNAADMKLQEGSAGFDFEAAGIPVPDQWNWVNVNGTSFVPAVRNQKKCGSCYAFSSTGAAMSRVRVASNNRDQRTASPQQIVSCATELSQGCDGGWPYLTAGKYNNEDVGFVSAECYPYDGATATGSATACRKEIACAGEEPIRVTTYGYVGTAFGRSRQDSMIRDLLMFGGLSVSFEVTPDFLAYTGGVYVPPTNSTKTTEDSELLGSPLPPAWQFVETNHVVVVVGYGHDDVSGLDYWLVQNSWGNSWGEKACPTCEAGYFRIVRGLDVPGGALGIEEMPVSFTVKTIA